MSEISRQSFQDLVLSPLRCITNACRPPKRKGNLDCSSLKGIHLSTKSEALYPVSEPTKGKVDHDLCSLEFKAELLRGSGSEASDQPQCSFLSDLPAEVRVMIYDYVLCIPVPVVHIVRRKDGSLCHVRCHAFKGECGTYRCYNEYGELSRSTKGASPPINDIPETFRGSLSLLLTCKKMSVFPFS